VKAIKPHVGRMCTSDEAQLVLFSALDIIEYVAVLSQTTSAHEGSYSDTKLTGKSLATDMVAHSSELVKSSQGRRALLYPLTGRTRRHLTPAQIAALAETDSARAITSKKDDIVRADEIRKACSESILEWIVKEGGAVARSTGGSLVVMDVMLYADGGRVSFLFSHNSYLNAPLDKTTAMQALLTPASAPYPSEDASLPHPIDLAHTARLYKTLLQGGHYSQTLRSVETLPYFSAPAFAEQWVSTVGRDITLASATGAGSFVVAALCERVAEDGSDEVRKTVREWFQYDRRKEIAEWEGRGKTVLEQAVDKLLAAT
jgi:pumilio homology domain family member 6